MRIRSWLISVPLLAASMGSIAAGCGDDTTNGTTTTDSGTPDTSTGTDATKPDTSTTPDAAKETGTDAAKEAAACVDAGINVANFDSGSPIWACYQQNCPSTLNPCAADCVCNTAIATALNCVAEGGVSQTTPCFTPAVSADMTAAMWFTGCVQNFMSACSEAGAAPPGDGGGDTGPTEAGGDGSGGEGGGDAGSDAGDAGTG